jgi:hypothetical protein
MVYFIGPASQADPSGTPEFAVHFLELPGGRIRDIATITGPLGTGFTVAPDRRSLIFVRNHPGTFDLKFVDGIR